MSLVGVHTITKWKQWQVINQEKQPGRFLKSLKNRIMIGLSKIPKTFVCGFTSLVLIPPALNQEKMVDSK